MNTMDLKLIEDLAALRRCGSYVRAAETRHVTHPAFGRRIRALQSWAGVPLVQDGRGPVQLTPAGLALLAEAEPLLAGLLRARAQWQPAGAAASPAVQTLRIGTGRTLARTMVADWLARMHTALRGHRVELCTRATAEIATLFERGEVDLLCCYEHAALNIGLSGHRFRHLTLGSDRLVPVSRTDASGRTRFSLDGAPWIAYAPSLALGRLVADHLAAVRDGAQPPPAIVCDSADAMLELAIKGLGMAWLPASLCTAAIKRGVLKPLGGRADQVHFEVRMYRPKARQSALVEKVWAATVR